MFIRNKAIRKLTIVFATAMMILLTSCSLPLSGETWSVRFGPRFLEIAQTTPEEWLAYLEKYAPKFSGKLEITGIGKFRSVTLIDYNGKRKWEYFAQQQLDKLRSEFASLPEHCCVEFGQDYGSLHFYLDHDVSPEVNEEFINKAKTLSAYMQLVKRNIKDADLSDVVVNTTDSHRLSLDYILANSQLTEKDFDGIDLDDFFDYCGIYSHNFEDHARLIPDLLGFYREDLQKAPTMDYGILYTLAYGTLSEDDLSKLEVILCTLHDGDYNQYLAIDLSTGKVYSSNSDFFDRCSDHYLTSCLTQVDREWLKDTIASSGITSWKNRYEGTSAGTTGHFGLSFAFRLTDGHCISYGASGVINSSMPKEMRALQIALFDHFFTRN